MATNPFLGIDLKQFVDAHKAKAGALYYKPIQRTGDLLTGSTGFLHDGNSKLLPEFFIAPSRVKIGALPADALNMLEKQLNLLKLPTEEDIVEMELQDLIRKYGGNRGERENILKATLQQKGFTGKIIQAAKQLNQSRLDPADREILSRSNLAMYTYYRAIEGLGVTDVEGIISNVYGSLTKIKSHINRELVGMVIKKENLKITPREEKTLQKEVGKIKLTYQEGEAEKIILEEYRQLKSGGKLTAAVNDFLDSGLVNLPADIDRETMVDKMVLYLLENGFNPEAIEGEDDKDARLEPDQFLVKGKIVNKQGDPMAGLLVRAKDLDPKGEEVLGNIVFTDAKGQYRILYTKEDFIGEGRESGGADIIIEVLNSKGNPLHQSGPHRNSPRIQTINLELETEKGAPAAKVATDK